MNIFMLYEVSSDVIPFLQFEKLRSTKFSEISRTVNDGIGIQSSSTRYYAVNCHAVSSSMLHVRIPNVSFYSLTLRFFNLLKTVWEKGNILWDRIYYGQVRWLSIFLDPLNLPVYPQGILFCYSVNFQGK